jgi:hypothetical protein
MKTIIPLDAEGPADAGAPKPAPAWFPAAILAAGAAQVLVFLAVAAAAAILKPYSDGYAFLSDALVWRDGGLSFPAYVWAPHVGHHAVWVRLLAALEVAGPRSQWPTVVAATFALVAAAGVLAAAAWSDKRLTVLRLPGAVVCGGLMLTSFNALDADQPINALYPFCVAFALASLVLFEPGEAGAKERPVRRGLALIAAAAAALGNGAALALWPILALVAATRGPRRILWTAVVVIVGLAFTAAYVQGEGEVGALAGGGAGEGGPLRRLVYLFDYLSLPWSQLSAAAGVILGLAIAALAAWGFSLSRTRGPTRTDRPAWSFILFGAATAVLAAAGRGGLGEVLRAPMRYAVFTAPLLAGVVMLLAPELERRLQGDGRRLATLALAAGAFLLAQQVGGGVLVLKRVGEIRAVIAAYERGERTPAMNPLIYPDFVFADRVEARLRAEKIFGKAPQELSAPPSPPGRTP